MSEMELTNRYKLIVLLGERCRICPNKNPADLEVDHIYNDGDEERAKYGSKEIYQYYLENPEIAFRRLQVLCKECHCLKTERFSITLYSSFSQVDLGVLQGRPHSEVSKMQLFMDVMKSLEGDDKFPIREEILIKELTDTNQFTEEMARKYIKKLQKESAIYESKPACYNRI